MSETNYRFVERDNRLSASQHRVFFAARVIPLITFFVWLFGFADRFDQHEKTWITVILLGIVVINVFVARALQQSRVILAVEGSTLSAGIAPHEYLQSLDLNDVTKILVHRQYIMLERPNHKPMQLIFAGKFRPLQGKLLTFLSQEFPNIHIVRMA